MGLPTGCLQKVLVMLFAAVAVDSLAAPDLRGGLILGVNDLTVWLLPHPLEFKINQRYGLLVPLHKPERNELQLPFYEVFQTISNLFTNIKTASINWYLLLPHPPSRWSKV